MTIASTTRPQADDPASASASIDLSGEVTSPWRLVAELWEARQLLTILARKEFHVRYRRASFGVLWALALPLLQAAVMAVVFSRVAHIHLPPHFSYGAFVLTAMAPWTYFTVALSVGSTGIVDGSDLSSRVYFPRAVLPLAQVGTALYAYAVTVVIVLVLCPLLHASLGLAVLLVVPTSLLLVALTAGFCLVASALHVYFRDVRYIVSAAMVVWMYLTPVIYPPADAPRTLRSFLDVNPMTGVVDLFHAATVGNAGPLLVPVVISVVWTVGLLAIGFVLHCRYDRVFADLL